MLEFKPSDSDWGQIEKSFYSFKESEEKAGAMFLLKFSFQIDR
jgi:hypothetical protein